MLVFDQLRKDDSQLRFLAMTVASGLLVLLIGLWWVQLVSTKHYKEKLEIQSIRTVRIPAARGKILDRNGRAMAENRPSYNIALYVEELSKDFQGAYSNSIAQVRANLRAQSEAKQKQLGRVLTPQEKKAFMVTHAMADQLQRQTRYMVVSNRIARLSERLETPINLPELTFQKWYDKSLALPLPLLPNGLNQLQLARFEEQSAAEPGLDLEVQSLRYYPNSAIAAHVLGYLGHDNDPSEEDTVDYDYRLPDFVGIAGIEGLFDKQLRGVAGEKSVLVNYLGYRQSETIWTPTEPGQNVVLTIDLDIQKAADAALLGAQANVRGAVVVMDAQNGDILAMASAPTFDPNHRIHPDPLTRQKEDERWADPQLGLQRNRAIYENYHPGSIFKVITGMAALELNVLDPAAIFRSDGYAMVGRRRIKDTAGPGEFDFNRAMAKSSNPYFIHYGTNAGVLQEMIVLGQRLHLGERTGIMPRQEARGNFPDLQRVSSNWHLGDTANVSIGQGEVDVTPVQMAVMTAAVANGGKVFWPRLVSRVEKADNGGVVETYPEGRVRDNLAVSQKTLRILHEGMLADVNSDEGTGSQLKSIGWNVAGKTGTAEVEKNGAKDQSAKNTWFVSFAPEENPRYVVVATVEGGASGGRTCVPIVEKIYRALLQREQTKGRVLATAK